MRILYFGVCVNVQSSKILSFHIKGYLYEQLKITLLFSLEKHYMLPLFSIVRVAQETLLNPFGKMCFTTDNDRNGHRVPTVDKTHSPGVVTQNIGYLQKKTVNILKEGGKD